MDILHSFFLCSGFVPLGFTDKVLTRQSPYPYDHHEEEHLHRMLIYCTLFSFVQVLSHWVLLARFLMRQSSCLYDHPRGSVIKYENF